MNSAAGALTRTRYTSSLESKREKVNNPDNLNNQK
jgi:hypothetical protein